MTDPDDLPAGRELDAAYRRVLAERDAARETNRYLHRRCQAAESARVAADRRIAKAMAATEILRHQNDGLRAEIVRLLPNGVFGRVADWFRDHW